MAKTLPKIQALWIETGLDQRKIQSGDTCTGVLQVQLWDTFHEGDRKAWQQPWQSPHLSPLLEASTRRVQGIIQKAEPGHLPKTAETPRAGKGARQIAAPYTFALR